MAKQIRQVGRVLLYALPLAVVVVLFVLPLRPSAADYTNPFWTNTSPSPECGCVDCPCEGPPEWSPEGVSVRTGELNWEHFLFRVPGLVEDNVFSLRWRSMIDGETEMGNGMLPSWMVTAQYVEINEQNPNGVGGHKGIIRKPSGLEYEHLWNGTKRWRR